MLTDPTHSQQQNNRQHTGYFPHIFTLNYNENLGNEKELPATSLLVALAMFVTPGPCAGLTPVGFLPLILWPGHARHSLLPQPLTQCGWPQPPPLYPPAIPPCQAPYRPSCGGVTPEHLLCVSPASLGLSSEGVLASLYEQFREPSPCHGVSCQTPQEPIIVRTSSLPLYR